MKSLVIVGLQWGDEGKGKLVDYLSEVFDVVARFQGGSNAGHTVIIGDTVHKFRIMPTGAIRGKKVVIGNGVVLDPEILLSEMEHLREAGIGIDLLLSDRAHLITPYHIEIDGLQESAKGKLKVGTTKRGIGPTYADKISRIGVRVCDFINNSGLELWNQLEDISRSRIEGVYKAEVRTSKTSSFSDYSKLLKKLSPFVGDCGEFLSQQLDLGKSVLFEGAQGSLLDIDHGTYPYVTSSNCVSAAAATGTGVSPQRINDVLGICKAYLTRVGTGPFPTELFNETGSIIRQRGGEFGTVTGRPRRCGWLDLVALRYAVRLNGAQHLAVTKLDVLSGIKTIKVCIGYKIDGEEVATLPASSDTYSKVEPVYEEIKGWNAPPENNWNEVVSQGFEALPVELLNYLKIIENYTSAKVAIASVGPDRTETLINTSFAPWDT
ncbi:MAG: adenylosuccinate synthase [Candidatus Thorarchaeota archaeon]